MSPKQRVEAIFNGEIPDRVPLHHAAISSAVASALLGREAYVGGGIQEWREARALWQGEEAHREYVERSYQDAIDLSMALECDIIRASYWRSPRKPTRQVDEHTFLFADGDDGRAGRSCIATRPWNCVRPPPTARGRTSRPLKIWKGPWWLESKP